MQKPQWPTDPTEKNITTKITSGTMCMIQATLTHKIHAQEQYVDTRIRLLNATQWGVYKKIRHTNGRKYEIL